MIITDVLPDDVLDLICSMLVDVKDLQSLSSCNHQLHRHVNDQFKPDNLSTINRTPRAQKILTHLERDFQRKSLTDVASHLIREDLIDKAGGLADLIDVSPTIETRVGTLGEGLEIGQTIPKLRRRAGGGLELEEEKKLTQLRLVAQARYVNEKIEKNYNCFWKALQSQGSFPDLKGSHAISAWLKDSNNHAALRAITFLKITGPDFIFFPSEAKNVLTALKHFNCSGCSALQTLDFEGYSELQGLSCIDCCSLQTLNVRGCSALQKFQCKNSASLQKVDFEGCSALRECKFYDCDLLQILAFKGCSALETLRCMNCTSFQSIDLKDLLTLREFNCSNCTSLRSINLEGCLMFQELTCMGCIMLQTVNLENCPAFQKAYYPGCTALLEKPHN